MKFENKQIQQFKPFTITFETPEEAANLIALIGITSDTIRDSLGENAYPHLALKKHSDSLSELYFNLNDHMDTCGFGEAEPARATVEFE